MSVLLISEHNNKDLKPFTLNAITAASQIDEDLHVLVIGNQADSVAKAVSEVKAGKIDFKVDKYGIVHASVAKASFDATKIADNADELIQTIVKLKPSSSKGSYIKSIVMSSTMGAGVKIDTKSY